MSGLMETLDYVRTYLDDLLLISKSSFDDHLTQIETVLCRLRDAGLRLNAAKSFFAEADRLEVILKNVISLPLLMRWACT